VTEHLVLGNTYKFKLRAQNIHGWSVDSDILTVMHSFVTVKPNPPTIIMENLFVKIAWVEPSDLRAAAVTAYRIKIKDSTGVYREDTINCNGATDQVRQQRYCLVHMIRLRADPYLLNYANLIQAKVQALNVNGWSEDSDPNSVGATI
jgi:hypothetical protein